MRLDPVKVAKRAQEIADTIENGEQFLLETLGESTMQDIERRAQIFDSIAKDFTCTLAKVSDNFHERSKLL